MRFPRPLRLVPVFVASLLFGTLAPTVSASAAVPVCADLQVQSFTISPATPIAGQQAVIHVTVHNGGTCTAFGATLQWKITPYAASGPSTQITSLGANATQTYDLPYTFLKAGNFESIAIVDTKNTVPETNEKNNTQILPVTVLAAGIDLQISSISTQPDPPVADGYPTDPVQGRNETTSIVVHNGGNTAAGPFQLKWVPKPFAPALTYQFSGLPANSSSSAIPFSYTYQQAGTFKSTATVDATNLVKETNERNNTATKMVRVDPQRADLIITDVQITPTPIIPGGLTTATITVKNQGNSPANAFMLSWRPQPFATPVSQQVGPLAVNQSVQVPLQFTYARAGSFTGLVTADSTKVVPEINENNNTLATHVVVAPNTVDLQITGETITGVQEEPTFGPASIQGGTVIGTPTQGVPVHVDIAVTNTGNTHSGPFLVDWNPDANYVVSPSLQTQTAEVADLGAGETTHVTFDFTYPVYGNFSTLTTLDPRNQVTETNEANNQNIVPITVVPAPIDLTVSLGVSPNPAVRGVPTTASVTVTNTGNFPASKPFTVQWFPTGSGGAPKSQVVQGLSPNSSTTLTFTNTYPVATKASPPTPYNSYAVVDSGNTIPETNEANNTSNIVQVTVVPQSTDVTVSLDHEVAFSTMEFTSGLGCAVDGEDCGNGEYEFIYLVYDPTTNCDVTIRTGESDHHELKIPKFYCAYQEVNDVAGDPNTNIGSPMPYTVHLVEQSPLVAGVGDLERDKHIPDIPGFSFFLASKDNYRTQTGLVKTAGQSCTHLDTGGSHPQLGGHCFDAYWGVQVVHDNAPTSGPAFSPVKFKNSTVASAAVTTDPGDGSWTQADAVTAMNDAFAQIQAIADAAAQQAGVPISQVRISLKSSRVK